jgi:chemotaxis methyl-accepting protein methylase
MDNPEQTELSADLQPDLQPDLESDLESNLESDLQSALEPEESEILREAQALFGRPDSPESIKKFLASYEKRRQRLDMAPAKFFNLVCSSPSEWQEIWNLWQAAQDYGFFAYPAQLEVLGQIIQESSPYAPERRLKILVLNGGAYEAASAAMLVYGLGLTAKGWEIIIDDLEMVTGAVRAAETGNFTKDALMPLPGDLVRRFFTPRAGEWHFKDLSSFQLNYWPINILRLDQVPDQIKGASVVLARGLSWDMPESEIAQLVSNVRSLMGEEALLLTNPGEFWPQMDDFSLEERVGVIYYRRSLIKPQPGVKRRTGVRKNPPPSKEEGEGKLSPKSLSLKWSAEEKMDAQPEEARLLAAEFLHEEALLGRFDRSGLELMAEIEKALGRLGAAKTILEVLESFKDPLNGL